MIFTEAERNLARDLFARVRIETAVPGGGITRESYGIGETRAIDVLAEEARNLGLETRYDPAANLYITPEGTWPTGAIVVGSHLDSVPCGGNFDGLAGVIAGLLIVLKAKRAGLNKPIVALGLRGEESAWYGVPYVGAKALMGKLTKNELDRPHRTRPRLTLRGAMAGTAAAFSGMTRIEAGERLLSESMISEFWELHIEQGPVLESEKIPVGLVTGVRGNVRAPNARVYGTPGHSGTTPHKLRQDAVVRFADLIMELENRRGKMEESAGTDLVFTCGIAGTDPQHHAMTKIASLVHFSLDIRSMSDDEANGFLEYAQRYAGDTVYWDDIVRTPSAWLSKALFSQTYMACKKLGVPFKDMPSGAGHDAAVFQGAGVPSGMVFVRNQGGSHNPHEDMNIDDFMLGVEVLWETVRS